MKKKRNLIGVCLVAVLMLALTVIGYAAGDGEAAPEYGAWCLVPPLVTIVLASLPSRPSSPCSSASG